MQQQRQMSRRNVCEHIASFARFLELNQPPSPHFVVFFDGGTDTGTDAGINGNFRREAQAGCGSARKERQRKRQFLVEPALEEFRAACGGLLDIRLCPYLADDAIVATIDEVGHHGAASRVESPERRDEGVCAPTKEAQYEAALAHLSENPVGSAVVVVTADKGLAHRCLDRGAKVMKCGPFLRMAGWRGGGGGRSMMKFFDKLDRLGISST